MGLVIPNIVMSLFMMAAREKWAARTFFYKRLSIPKFIHLLHFSLLMTDEKFVYQISSNDARERGAGGGC